MRVLLVLLGLVALPVQAQLCSASLTWAAPTENTDGSPYTNPAGSKIYWGLSPGTYSQSITIDDPSVTSIVVNNLADGTWYFAATAYNQDDVESAYSNEASKTVQNCATLPDPREPGPLVIDPDFNFTVFDYVPQVNRTIMLPVGSAPSGTACIAGEMIVSQGVSYWAIPREEVSFAGTVTPDIVYARCRMP